jgi:hypothetical protein
VIGVLPASAEASPPAPPPGYPNSWVEIPLRTHLPLSGARGTDPLSRNHLNVLSSDVIVALPGAAGTASETRLALRYGRPLVAWLEARTEIENLDPEVRVLPTFAEVQDFVRSHLPRR